MDPWLVPGSAAHHELERATNHAGGYGIDRMCVGYPIDLLTQTSDRDLRNELPFPVEIRRTDWVHIDPSLFSMEALSRGFVEHTGSGLLVPSTARMKLQAQRHRGHYSADITSVVYDKEGGTYRTTFFFDQDSLVDSGAFRH